MFKLISIFDSVCCDACYRLVKLTSECVTLMRGAQTPIQYDYNSSERVDL